MEKLQGGRGGGGCDTAVVASSSSSSSSLASAAASSSSSASLVASKIGIMLGAGRRRRNSSGNSSGRGSSEGGSSCSETGAGGGAWQEGPRQRSRLSVPGEAPAASLPPPPPPPPPLFDLGDDGSPVGSPYLMSPEAVEASTADGALLPALDVWSAGALAVELVTGSPPYAHLPPMAALLRIVQDSEPPIPGISSSSSSSSSTGRPRTCSS